MEAKQFPEKWAVSAYEIYLTPIEKYINNSHNLFLDVKECDAVEWYFTYNGDLGWSRDIDGYTEVTLEELIAHYEPTTHPKWMPLTQGGLEVHINEEFEGKLFGRIKHEDNKWSSNCWYLNGNDFYEYSERNLIPYNPRISELEEKIESKRSELAELEGELKELKK